MAVRRAAALIGIDNDLAFFHPSEAMDLLHPFMIASKGYLTYALRTSMGSLSRSFIVCSACAGRPSAYLPIK